MLKKWGITTDIDFMSGESPEEVVRMALSRSFRNLATRVEMKGDNGKYLYVIPEEVKVGIIRNGLDIRLTVHCSGGAAHGEPSGEEPGDAPA